MFTVYNSDNLTPARSTPSLNKPVMDLESVAKDLESAAKDLDKLVADLPPSSPPSTSDNIPLSSSSPLQMFCDLLVPPTSVASDTTALSDDRSDDVKAPTLLELLGQRKVQQTY